VRCCPWPHALLGLRGQVITQTGLLEFKVGSAERGRSVFEGVLRNYPRRLDLWSVYLDQEVRLGDAQRVRALFQRATALSLPAKKMKVRALRWCLVTVGCVGVTSLWLPLRVCCSLDEGVGGMKPLCLRFLYPTALNAVPWKSGSTRQLCCLADSWWSPCCSSSSSGGWTTRRSTETRLRLRASSRPLKNMWNSRSTDERGELRLFLQRVRLRVCRRACIFQQSLQ
jgi:hypothetical protein